MKIKTEEMKTKSDQKERTLVWEMLLLHVGEDESVYVKVIVTQLYITVYMKNYKLCSHKVKR